MAIHSSIMEGRELAGEQAQGLTAPNGVDDGRLSPLSPAFVKLLRVRLGLFAVVPVLGALVLEVRGLPLPGMALAPVLLLAALVVLLLPVRLYRSRGYDMSGDQLRVIKGTLFHRDTTVPFGRVQHLDVEQSPLERALGLATLVLHTAGTHNASVSLPGLEHARAIELREAIRAHVRRETM